MGSGPGGYAQTETESLDSRQAPADNAQKYSKLNQVYLFILSRYRDYIEEKERISVAELPILVTPKNQLVVKKVDEIKGLFNNYSYEVNFHEASLKAFQFVTEEIDDISLPLQFWLMPEETLQFMIGDLTDKGILLCSLLIALGNPSSKVFVAIDDNRRNVDVYYEFNDSIILFDMEEGGIKSFKKKDDMVSSFNLTDDSTAYEFNDQMYIDIQ